MLVLQRLRLANGEPLGAQTAHIPLDLAPGLRDEDFADAFLYELLQTRYNLRATGAPEQYYAASADALSAELLGIPLGAPVSPLSMALTKSGAPFEFTESIVRGDRYSIVLNLMKDSRRADSSLEIL